MQKAIIATLALLCGCLLFGQSEGPCLPNQLIVAATDLNFRAGPSTDSRIIGKLGDAERLTLIEVHEQQERLLWSAFHYSWLKVERGQTGEQGYVFGKYVKTPEMAYLNHHDSDRAQRGNWYGIYQEGGKTKIEKTVPKFKEEDDHAPVIYSKDAHTILICTQEEVKEGEVQGQLFENERAYLKVGTKKELISIGKASFSLVFTGEVVLKPPILIRKNERVIFLTTLFVGPERHYIQQDLTDCLSQFGEVGYQVHFAGDLNGDGIPELILSEATTRQASVYYFRSNQDGQLELVSITGAVSRC